MNSEIHDSITQQKGSLTTLLNNIKELQKTGIRIRVKTPLMKKI